MKVLSGRYEGDTGLIVRIEENRAVLFSDLTMHELEVLPRDLQLCSDMATGVDSMGQFQWGDLVQLELVILQSNEFFNNNNFTTIKNESHLQSANGRSHRTSRKR